MSHRHQGNFFSYRQPKLGGICALALALMATSPAAHAEVTVQVCQQSSGVVFDGNGTLNLADLNIEGDGYLFDGVDIDEFVIGGTDNGCPECNSGFDRVDIRGADNEITPPANLPFTLVDNFFQTTISDGGRFGLVPFRNPYSLNVPDLYGSGDPYTGSSTFANQTFESMGLMSGFYTWTWGDGEDADSVTLAIGNPGPHYDQNGDRRSDVLWRNNATGDNKLYIMDSEIVDQNLPLSSEVVDWKVVGRGDYNGDGKSGILWRHTPTGAVWMYLTDINSAALLPAFVATIGDPNWKIVGNGDYNGDGKSDILFHHALNGTVWLYQMDSNVRLASNGIGTVPDLDWSIVGSGDYDGDGKSDIFWRNSVSGSTWMYLMDGATISTSMRVSTTATSYEVVGNGDYNGDGKSDILWRNSVSGTNWIFMMDGPSIATSGWISAVPDLNWKVVGDGDYNGDCTSDVLWRNMSNGHNYMYLLSGFTIIGGGNVDPEPDQDWQIVNTN